MGKEAQYWENREFISDLVNHLPFFIFWKDKNSVFRGCNHNFALSAGLTDSAHIVGKTDYDLPWEKYQSDIYRADDKAVMESRTAKLNIEEPQTLPNGKKIVLLTSKVPLFDKSGSVMGILGIYMDITDRKKQEDDLEKAKMESELANQLKTEFIHNMQHDIRTPFSGIYGMAKLLADKESDSEKKELLMDITLSAKELLDYCNDILDFSKFDRGMRPVLLKSFDLRKLINNVISMELPAATHKKLNLTLHYDDNLPNILMGDTYRLKRILINLVSNAIKFTKKGYVKLIAEFESRKEAERTIIIKFVVEDSGIGIEDEKKELIYERFMKVTASNKGLYTGQGLGLYIVKQFLHNLDGDIHLKSELNKGSTFTLYIPFKIPLSEDIIDED